MRRTLWVLLLGFVACKREKLEDIAFDQTESLPGFTIGLPTGKRVKSEVAPAAGQVIIEHEGTVVTVGWQAGRMGKDELPTIAAGMQAVVASGMVTGAPEGTDVAVPEPNYGTEFVLPTDKKVFLAMSVIQCVKSNVTVTLATMGAPERERAKAFNDRLVATLQCGDEASAMAADIGLPAFDQGDAIGYLPGSDPPSFFSTAGARWYVTPGIASMRAAFERPEAVAAMMKGLGVEITEQTQLSAPSEWLLVQLKTSVGGETGFMLAGVLTCGEAAFSVMHTKGDMTAPDPADVGRMTCPTKRIDPATLPTVEDRIGKPCDGGDVTACEVLAMLASEESKLLPGRDPAKLRSRACELGAKHLCAG